VWGCVGRFHHPVPGETQPLLLKSDQEIDGETETGIYAEIREGQIRPSHEKKDCNVDQVIVDKTVSNVGGGQGS